jgi:hypothetical protein
MNPIEQIENDKRLTALLNGLRSQWGLSDEFLTIVLWHTDDYDYANEVIDTHLSSDNLESPLEEVLQKVLPKKEFERLCLESDFLDYSKCKEVYKLYE